MVEILQRHGPNHPKVKEVSVVGYPDKIMDYKIFAFIIPKDKILSFYKTSRPGLHAFRAFTGAAAIIALNKLSLPTVEASKPLSAII